MNPQTIVVIIILALLFVIALKGAGKSKCSGGCSGCPYSGSCHKEK